MSGLMKNILKPNYLRSASNFLFPKMPASQYSRSMWNLTSAAHKRSDLNKNAGFCGCDNQKFFVHTKGGSDQSKAASQKIDQVTQGEKELAEFLTEEIAAEKKLQSRGVPNEVNGFEVHLDGSAVTLAKKTGEEQITVKFNVNHSVGEETEYDIPETEVTKDEEKNIINRPPFDVEINRSGKVLAFRCSMVVPPPKDSQAEEGYNDLFTIDEVIMCEGKWKDSNYRVPGEIMDGTLYDLLMNLLEDKGIGNELVQKLTNFSTDYEHSLYVNLLEDLQRFVSPSK